MTVYGVLLIVVVCGYASLTIMGVVATLDANKFVTKAVGREGPRDPHPWHIILLGLFYILVYMWAVGLVSTWKGGTTKMYRKVAKQAAENQDLSADEIHRLRVALEELEETSQFNG